MDTTQYYSAMSKGRKEQRERYLKNKCEMCGRSAQSMPLTYFVEYGVWLCNDCLNSVVETNKNLFGKHPCLQKLEKDKRRRMISDYAHFINKKQEEKTMDYNKKKDTSIDVKRNVTREEVVTINSLRDLNGGDKIKVMINGEVYEAKVARRPPIDYSGEAELAIAVYIDKPLSKSWRELGYSSFEDMIDDIAKEHGSLGRRDLGYNSFEDMIKEGRITSPSNYIKIHDAAHEGKKYVYADSFGKSIIRVINDGGSSTIYDADRFQVYLEEEDD